MLIIYYVGNGPKGTAGAKLYCPQLSLPCESFGAQSSRLLQQCPRRSSPVFAQQATVHSPCIGPTRAEVTRIGQCLRLDAGRAPLASSATQNPVQALLHRLQMSPRCCTTLPIRVLSTALLPRRSLSASISCRWRSFNSTLKNCDDWASRIFDIRPSCLEWSSNKLERSYTNFSGLQETIENTLFHDDVNSGNAPLRRLFERRITNTSFNSIQFYMGPRAETC